MKKACGPATSFVFLGALVLSCLLLLPAEMQAQGNLGNNAVFNSSGNCNSCIGSSAFIDAVVVSVHFSNADICTTINDILTAKPPLPSYPPAGAVIDARGMTSAGVLTCTTAPWGSGSGYVNKPSTILLPSGTIQISNSWILPNGTRLIGEGTTGANDLTSSGSALPTTIQNSGGLTSGAMIQFGDATDCPQSVCMGISVEHLTIDGNNQAVTGILNENAQDNSYASHVTLYRVLGTGLSIGANPSGGNAQNSGPYDNINYDTGSSGTSQSICASINGLASTHGMHGLSCISSTVSQHAVLLDSSNNTLKDVRIVGFFDGVLIGANAAAYGNVLQNIIGDTADCSSCVQPPVYVVHISKSNNQVAALSIMDVNNVLGNGQPQNNEFAIYDELTSTYLAEPYVAMYALGNSANGGYSRFTTSPSVADWTFGNSSPATGSTCPTGSLYSCTGGTSNCNYALYACVNSAWAHIK